MKRIVFGLVLGVIGNYTVANLSAQVIYQQTPIAEGSSVGVDGMTAYSSTTDLNPPLRTPSPYPTTGRQDYRTFDSFTVGSAFSVKSVEWWGTYDESTAGDLQKFHIAFWADNTGLPPGIGDTSLAAYDLMGNAHETAAGALSVSGDALGVFSYYAVLPTAFAQSGGTYWMSIVGDVFAKDKDINQPEEGLWQWWASDQGAPDVYQDSDLEVWGGNDDGTVDLDEARYLFDGGNAAFRLSSAAIPEPASLVAWGLLMLGGIGATVVRRRKRK